MKSFSKAALAAVLCMMCLLPVSYADMDKAVTKLPARSFCINADLQTAWEETAQVLRQMEIPVTLADDKFHIIATAFVFADYNRLFKISKNAHPFLKGRFTMKISLEQVTDAYTKFNVVLQIRQNKAIGSGERLLKSRGTFEKYLAYQIDRRAIGRKYPGIYGIDLGMDLIPDLKTERYHVADIEPGSPAAKAGLQPGDEVTGIDGRHISIRGELFEALLSKKAGQDYEFTVRRKGSEIKANVHHA